VFKYQLIWIRTLGEEAFCVTPPPSQKSKTIGLNVVAVLTIRVSLWLCMDFPNVILVRPRRLLSGNFISSFQEWAYTMARHRASVVCLSVCLSVNFCTNRFFFQANGQIATKLSQDGFQVSVHPGCAQGEGQSQRSRYTGTFMLARKSLLLPRKWLDRDQPCTRRSPGKPTSRVCSKFRLTWKVTWYQHIWNFTKIDNSAFP